MDVVGVVVVVEVYCKDNMELSMENIEDIMDGSYKFLSNLIANISFGVEMTKVANKRVCSN